MIYSRFDSCQYIHSMHCIAAARSCPNLTCLLHASFPPLLTQQITVTVTVTVAIPAPAAIAMPLDFTTWRRESAANISSRRSHGVESRSLPNGGYGLQNTKSMQEKSLLAVVGQKTTYAYWKGTTRPRLQFSMLYLILGTQPNPRPLLDPYQFGDA